MKQEQPELMKVTIRDVRKTLAAGMNLRAMKLGITREKMLLNLIEHEFSEDEELVISLKGDLSEAKNW